MKKLSLLAAAGSIAMLLGAFAFEYFGDMPPCKLCIWQRWPHGIAGALGVVMLMIPHRFIALIGGLVVLGGAGVAFYHTGVELHIFQGPTSCTSSGIAGLSVDDLLAQITATPVIRCDEVPWAMFGISMAAWNGIVSLGLSGLWFLGFAKGK